MRDGEVYDLDGSFVENLAAFCGDTNWQQLTQRIDHYQSCCVASTYYVPHQAIS